MEATKGVRSPISREKFSSFVSGLLKGTLILKARHSRQDHGIHSYGRPFEKVFGPQPEPWRVRFESADERLRNLGRTKPAIWDVIGGGFETVALNPQPLPPRCAFAVEFMCLAADRLVMIQETAEIINQSNNRDIIVVGGKISELIDFICGNNFPRRIPPPRGGEPEGRLTGQELVLMGGQLVRYSKTMAAKHSATNLAGAGENLIDDGLERL